MRFAFIWCHEDVFRIASMCRVLSVTRQGYHAWRCRPPSARAVANLGQQGLILTDRGFSTGPKASGTCVFQSR